MRNANMNGHKKLIIRLLLTLALLVEGSACFAQQSLEHNELTAISRQLELMQRLVAAKANTPINQRSRYYFNYKRLNADLVKIRRGINDYLTPQRAQPRDLMELTDSYQEEQR